jgi:peptidoglycan hydrolase-like protein with peptidoglycan-binding domain
MDKRRIVTIGAGVLLTIAGLIITPGSASAAPAVTAESPAGIESISIPIGPGSSGVSVRQWQTDLRAWQIFWAQCRPSVTIDGVFGTMTASATRCFQRAEGLDDDAVVGEQTLDAMCFELIAMRRWDLYDNSSC